MLRHARSQSILQQQCRSGQFEPSFEDIMALSSLLLTVPTWETAPLDAIAAGGTSTTTGGKKRVTVIRSISVHAEISARGLDSALDFVGRFGLGTV